MKLIYVVGMNSKMFSIKNGVCRIYHSLIGTHKIWIHWLMLAIFVCINDITTNSIRKKICVIEVITFFFLSKKVCENFIDRLQGHTKFKLITVCKH